MTTIFNFFPDTQYFIVLEGNITLEGTVIDTLNDGIVLQDGTHIPESKILFFRAISGTTDE